MRLLLAEDDEMIGENLCHALTDEAYTVDWVKDGRDAILTLKVQDYDLIILDLGLPHVDGMGVLSSIRTAKIDTPVLVLTARDSIKDKISGLDAGADDYLIKPFDLGELLARIRVLIRRSSHHADNRLELGNIILDTKGKTATQDGKPVALTAKEYMLLHTFMSSPNQVLSKTALEDSLYGWGMEVESNAVEFLIYSLRKKFGNQSIKNMRGMGWYMRDTTS